MKFYYNIQLWHETYKGIVEKSEKEGEEKIWIARETYRRITKYDKKEDDWKTVGNESDYNKEIYCTSLNGTEPTYDEVREELYKAYNLEGRGGRIRFYS